ncbi:hypothetical protein DFH27DRAFT_634010 [Peziza echinospora]|nr:hypothetical protein DFH27DRAFT_634010 [Peziza echinospora]
MARRRSVARRSVRRSVAHGAEEVSGAEVSGGGSFSPLAWEGGGQRSRGLAGSTDSSGDPKPEGIDSKIPIPLRIMAPACTPSNSLVRRAAHIFVRISGEHSSQNSTLFHDVSEVLSHIDRESRKHLLKDLSNHRLEPDLAAFRLSFSQWKSTCSHFESRLSRLENHEAVAGILTKLPQQELVTKRPVSKSITALKSDSLVCQTRIPLQSKHRLAPFAPAPAQLQRDQLKLDNSAFVYPETPSTPSTTALSLPRPSYSPITPEPQEATMAEEMELLKARIVELETRLRNTESERAKAEKIKTLEAKLEAERKKAYEDAGLTYPGSTAAAPGLPTSINLVLPDNFARSARATPVDPEEREYLISHKSIGYLKPSMFDNKSFSAINGDTWTRPYSWLRHLKSKLDAKDSFAYKAAVMDTACDCLQGRAAAWWTAIGPLRSQLRADFTLKLWYQHIAVLCPSSEQMRREALARQWAQSSESAMDYVWDKAAMFEETDSKMPLSSVIAEVIQGLPSSLARMLRTDLDPNSSLDDLCRELQMVLPKWQRERDETPSAVATVSSRSRSTKQVTTAAKTTTSSAVREMRPYDKSKISMKMHPTTRKLTRCYEKPNGRSIFLDRPCLKCKGDHFDFEHDDVVATAAFADDEDYPEYQLSDASNNDDDLN